jgi:hypothetical protein
MDTTGSCDFRGEQPRYEVTQRLPQCAMQDPKVFPSIGPSVGAYTVHFHVEIQNPPHQDRLKVNPI